MDQTITFDNFLGELSEDVIRLRNVGFRLLYETGKPVPVDLIAERSGYIPAEVEEILSMPDLVGRVRRDEEGGLVGIAGLSVEPTPHEIHIGRRRLWAWCALDAVGIFAAMRATGNVYSTLPDGSERLEIRFEDGAGVSDHTLFILAGFDGINSVESWCPSVNFFAKPDDATAWARDRGLEGNVVSIGQIADSAAEIWGPVVIEVGPVDG